MRITASAISLNVEDVSASAAFMKRHFGFTEDMSADGFVSLSRKDAGFNLIFLRTGLESLKPESLKHRKAEGILVAFVVDDIDAEYRRLQDEGVRILTPIETEPWGERFFQVADDNGVILQLVQWMHPPPEGVVS
ncbi:VOC family protein [Myxococcus sp. MISCRS1]|jgi:catechol 2,3-dioxygenase-like lactoylglutathione lyase family enzyme|uniref:VOC family protein n=1 Tax=Myxococcus TaxID=32 RepID=UPI001CBE117D|nr:MULTISPECIES: VOC family protein [unclassified Myxococcus]MBZ4396067.1 VOC family protein [Myxococcus sp. AS-1-15]MBZ4408822.1 VOC family protein [Myxococcus sp. XM-1-1-1]MCY1000884.1 VOC family protein [Myxococcus sp. MISCRS1]BDT37572.1 VOC family protein [Myxococcus sp. MH1]